MSTLTAPAVTFDVVIDPASLRMNFDKMALRNFRDAATQLRGLLQEMRCTRGHFTLRPIEQKTWKSQARILVRGEEPHNRDRSFYIRLKPGDNGTTWDYVLSVPEDMSAKDLQSQLVAFIEKTQAGQPDRPVGDEQPPVASAAVPASPPPSPTQELGNLFQRLHNALQRKEQRDSQIADLQTRIREISVERERLEQSCLELIGESEQDKEAVDAQSLLATLRNFTQPQAV